MSISRGQTATTRRRTTAFELPPFYCPLPAGRPHPAVGQIEKNSLAWMESFGFFPTPADRRRAEATRSHELMSMLTPDAPRELVQTGADWAYLAFAFDDLRSDTGPTSTSTAVLVDWFHALDYACTTFTPPTSDLFHNAAADLSRRIHSVTTPALWRRWLTENRQTYWAGAWECAQRTSEGPVSFDAYLAIRSYLGLAPSTLVAAEIALCLDVPEREREDPPVRAAIEATWLLIVIDDDLYSYPKEHLAAEEAGRDPLLEPTAIPILMRERNLGVTQAAAFLGDLRDRVMLRAVRLSERIAVGNYSRDTRALVDAALRSVRAGLDWAQRAERYTNPDGRSPGAIDLRWNGITHIPPAADTPPSYPAIDWWWDV